MQLTLASSALLAALLVPHPAAEPAQPPISSHPVVDTEPVVLPLTSPCPAYLGPQCDSVQHEQIATGQTIAGLALGQ